MANDVYANNREIACKKASGKSICAFPDVCFTPPQTPATPPGVPIPYPNTGMASDTTKGSKKTKISGAEIMLKNQSHFKTSYGDEAGCAPKKGLITSKNKGKIYFKAWSMDVKVEGKNAVRHLDLTTHNHASEVGQTVPHPYLDAMAIGNPPECSDLESTLEKTLEEELPKSRKKAAVIGLGMTQGDPGSMIGGASSISASTVKRGGKYAHWAKGIQQKETSDIKTCDGDTFKYEKSGRPYTGHAEAKMIEDFFKNGPKGTLMIAVSKSPCKECSRLINAVNKGKDGKNCNKVIVCEGSV